MKRRLLNAAVCSDVLYHAVLCVGGGAKLTQLLLRQNGDGVVDLKWGSISVLLLYTREASVSLRPASLQRSVVGRLLFN